MGIISEMLNVEPKLKTAIEQQLTLKEVKDICKKTEEEILKEVDVNAKAIENLADMTAQQDEALSKQAEYIKNIREAYEYELSKLELQIRGVRVFYGFGFIITWLFLIMSIVL